MPSSEPTAPAARPARPGLRRSILTHGAVGVLCLAVGAAIGVPGGTEDGGGAAEQSLTAGAWTAPAPAAAEETPEPAGEPADSGASFGPGVYLVGEDIAPGEYRTAGPAAGVLAPLCRWTLTSDPGGGFDAVLANGMPDGPARVTVAEGAYFETSGCAWEPA
ncbi:hypothetical protein [Streptomyces sp. RFCAC02]|uniref:hypothetical protein n=1 Tax=Streptomyces sp. RFCAC02 TaxID=2499143 RepID=UPI00101ED4B1|nr:hypothetical protein [Streptomyces sp. RFCAC02]